MKAANQKIEISITNKERAIIDVLSRQYKMTNDELVRTLLFDSGILSASEEIKRQ